MKLGLNAMEIIEIFELKVHTTLYSNPSFL